MDVIHQFIARLKLHLGMSISVFLHLSLLILISVNFPQCQRKQPAARVIAVDLLPIAQTSNIENKQVKTEKPKLEEKPKESTKQITEPVEKPEPKPVEEPKPEPNPLPSKEKIQKVEQKKSKSKPAEAKKIEPKKKSAPAKLNEMDKLLKDLRALEQKNDAQEHISDKPSKGPHRADAPLSLSIKDSIRQQVESWWNPPAGNKNAASLQILLRISFKQDGSVANVRVIDNLRYSSDELYRVAADAAVRAVYKASPLKNLPIDQYSIWQDLEFNFNPSEILGD